MVRSSQNSPCYHDIMPFKLMEQTPHSNIFCRYIHSIQKIWYFIILLHIFHKNVLCYSYCYHLKKYIILSLFISHIHIFVPSFGLLDCKTWIFISLCIHQKEIINNVKPIKGSTFSKNCLFLIFFK